MQEPSNGLAEECDIESTHFTINTDSHMKIQINEIQVLILPQNQKRLSH